MRASLLISALDVSGGVGADPAGQASQRNGLGLQRGGWDGSVRFRAGGLGHQLIQVIEIHLQRLAHGEGLAAPSYATEGAAGLDPWARYAQVLLLANEFLFVD